MDDAERVRFGNRLARLQQVPDRRERGSGPWRLSTAPRSAPSRYSMTMNGRSSSASTSSTLATVLAADAKRSARLTHQACLRFGREQPVHVWKFYGHQLWQASGACQNHDALSTARDLPLDPIFVRQDCAWDDFTRSASRAAIQTSIVQPVDGGRPG